MIRSDSPYVVDIYLVSIRWVLYFSAIIGLVSSQGVQSMGSIPIVLIGIWNFLQLLMAARSQRFTFHRETILTADVVFAATFSMFGAPEAVPQLLVLLIPISTAAMYYNVAGAFACALITSLVCFVTTKMPIGLYSSAAMIAYSLLFGYIGKANYEHIQKNRRWQMELREIQHATEANRMRSIYLLASQITSILNYRRVLESALELAGDSLSIFDGNLNLTEQSSQLSSAILIADQGTYRLMTCKNLNKGNLPEKLAGEAGLLSQLGAGITETKSIDPADDPEVATLFPADKHQSVLAIPILENNNLEGVMLFGHPDRAYFTPARCEILALIHQQAVVALHNARLYEEVSDEKDKIAEVEEETRKKIARDLHDGPTQSVTAIALRVNLARRLLSRDPDLTADELTKIETLARQTTKEIRHMLFSLRPVILETEGLAAAMHAIGEKTRDIFGKPIHIIIDELAAARVDLAKGSGIFYVIDEAVTNAQKHANAKKIMVTLAIAKTHPDILSVEVNDDGVGFDLVEAENALGKRESLGLINMRERAEMLNGNISIQSHPGKGTRIHLFVPLTEAAAEYLHEH